MSDTPLRILITGSRYLRDPKPIEDAIHELGFMAPAQLVLIHGGAEGADSLVDQLAETSFNGCRVLRYPVDHSIDGPWPGAGPHRNARMIERAIQKLGGIDVCLAFPAMDRESKGTEGCARLAWKAGVVVRTQGVRTQ